MSTIVHDAFTKRLLQVFKALNELPAFRFKKDFTKPAAIANTHWINIEKNERNYPQDDTRREKCKLGLFSAFGVNPDFMDGKSEKMFARQPIKLDRVESRDTVKYNFANRVEKGKVLAELEYYKKQYQKLAKQIGIAAEPYVPYGKGENPAKNSDKKK